MIRRLAITLLIAACITPKGAISTEGRSTVKAIESSEMPPVVIGPQPGPQEAFLRTPADLAIYGGAAGGGKTYGLLMEAARNIHIPGYYAVIFRRVTPEITNEGALWDDSQMIYRSMGGVPRETKLSWRFRAQSRIRFAHLEYENTKYSWQGSQLAFVGFDQLCQFTRGQFWYLFSRLRSGSGVRGYMRATCNPEPDSFVAEMVKWYIDPDTGYADHERSGTLRYFYRLANDELDWSSNREELVAKHCPDNPTKVKSFTFIAAKVDDNPLMLEKNPDYKGNLEILDLVHRERLLHGNWHIRQAAGTIFKSEWFRQVPMGCNGGRVVRYWDRAATEVDAASPDPDWTVGCKVRFGDDGYYYIEDVVRFRGRPAAVKSRILNTAIADGLECEVLLARDPAQAGKSEALMLIQHLAGFNVRAIRETKKKFIRAAPVSAQSEAGNVRIVQGDEPHPHRWIRPFLHELENFGSNKGHDDQADAYSGAMNALMVTVHEPSAGWL